MDIDFGSRIDLTDGTHVTVDDVVVDPYHLRLTHLALGRGGEEPTRLVPISDVTDDVGGMRLPCDHAGFMGYPVMNELSYVRITEPVDAGPGYDVGVTDVLTLPYYDADLGVKYSPEQTVAWHRVPVGEVEIRRRSRVSTSDLLDAGHVEGFVTDDQRRVTHVVIDHGHLFGHRDLIVPLADIDEIRNDQVTLALTREQVRGLPRADVRSWWDRHGPQRHARQSATARLPAGRAAPAPHSPSRTFHPDGIHAEHPQDEGITLHDPDSAHDEACHLLANDAAPVLMRDGLSREEVWEWSEAFLAANGHGNIDDLVAWIRARQHLDAPVSP